MSSRVITCTCLLLSATAALAQDWGDFALRSDRSADALLVSVMNESDLDTALAICEGVARRDDVHATAIIEAIAGRRTGSRSLRSETLLRVLLEGLFDPGRASPTLPVRVAANADAIESLLDALPAWRDPQLVASLVRIMPVFEAPSRLPALMGAGARIIRNIQAAGGLLNPQETSLAMDFLLNVAAIDNLDFLEQCVSIARLSADADLVKAARSTALALKGSRQPSP